MRLRRLVRKLELSLAGLFGGFAIACSGSGPGEAPPLGPRPVPVQPLPGGKRLLPVRDRTTAPGDAGATVIESAPQFESSTSPAPSSPPPDASDDTLDLPPLPDALPPDANKQPETAFRCC